MKNSAACLLLLLVFLFKTECVFSQLEFIAPIEVQINDTPAMSGSLLLNTIDFRPAASLQALYPSSLQIIDPINPWPPLFFTNSLPGGDGFTGNGIYQDFRYRELTQQLTFYFGSQVDTGEPAIGKYYFSDTSFSIIDSFAAPNMNIDPHDLQINAAGEKLYMANYDTVVNIAALTGNLADSTFLLTYQRIEIVDSNNTLLFSWNPLDFIPISNTYEDFSVQGFVLDFYNGFDWSHGNSARFAQDGNILYSYRNVGMGKVERSSGNLLWQLAGKTPVIAPPANRYPYHQHDFKEIAPGIYTVFANGNDTIPCRALVYSINETANTAKVLRAYEPVPAIISRGLGNFDLEADDSLCLINYGGYASFIRQKAFSIVDTVTGNVLCDYTTPGLTFCYQVHRIKTWKPARPVILNTADTLRVAGASAGISWYQLGGANLTKVADADVYAPADSGTFLATVRTGFGWRVTAPYYFTLQDSLPNSNRELALQNNQHIFFSTNGKIQTRYNGQYDIYNTAGQLLWSGSGAADISSLRTQLLFVRTADGYRQKLLYVRN